MIIFKKVSWKNFLSTGNIPTVIELDKTPTTILVGESGAGKSTLLDAISFALFNKPFRSVNKNNIVNSINNKDCMTEIEFSVGAKEYLVRRGIKPNIFEIYCDGQLINQDSSAKDYQVYLERQILKFNYRSFSQIIVLGASNFTPFMLLKPADRRLIIEELLDIQVFSVMNTLLKQRMLDLRTSSQENENQISLLLEKIKVHQKYIADLHADNLSQIEQAEANIKENRKHEATLQLEMNELHQTLGGLQASIAFEVEVNDKMKKLLEIESKLEDRVRKEKKDIAFYQKNDDCPTCKQKIADTFKQSEIDSKTKKLDEIDNALKEITGRLKTLEEKKSSADSIKDEIAKVQFDITKKNASIMAIVSFIEKLEKEIAELKQPKNKIAEEQDVLNTFESDLNTLESTKRDLSDERNLHDLANALLKDTGIKARIIKQYLPLINKYTNKYLSDMSFFVTFTMNENFEEQIKARGRDDFSYGNFSDGEKQRLDLALLFTWREIARIKNSVNTNLLILDEIADSYLDLESTENILQLLTSDVFKGLNIILISHKNTIADKFDRVIRFKKDKNFSKAT